MDFLKPKLPEPGYNVTLCKKDYNEPVIIHCENEFIELRYSKRCSRNSITVNITAPKNVFISSPSTTIKLKEILKEFSEVLEDLSNLPIVGAKAKEVLDKYRRD